MADARRFYMVDLDFFHKKTFDRLYDEFGAAGPLVWLALIAEAKRSRIPGTLTVTGGADFWAQLGFQGRDLGFTMDAFLAFTGRYKLTSRTSLGRLQNVLITSFKQWQNDWKRESERTRKSRYRAQRDGDTEGTGEGQQRDRELDLDLYPPNPPNGGNVNGENQPLAAPPPRSRANEDPRLRTHPFVCKICSVRERFDRKLVEHFYVVHDLMQEPLEAAVLEHDLSLDCIPEHIPRAT